VLFFHGVIGTVHTELNDLDEALTCFKNAVKIERSVVYLQSLGVCLVQMKDYENAYVCLTGECVTQKCS
jgi:tetratricopeptide (TPR) repeat protein